MAITWTRCLEEQVQYLRDVEQMDWPQIAERLDFATPDQPRIRFSRLKNGQVYSDGESCLGRPQDRLEASVRKNAPPAPAPAQPAPVEYEIEARFAKNDYDFDGEKYYFPVNNQVVKIPKAAWERIVAAYSAEGGDQVQAAIAMELGMHKKVLEACLRAYGHFKARPPVTREALAEATRAGDLEPLYEKAIEVQEATFLQGLRHHKLGVLERENRDLKKALHARMAEQASFVDAVAATLGPEAAPRDVLKVTPLPGNDYSLVVTLFDPHFGLRVHGRQGFRKDFDTDLAADYVRRVFRAAAEYVAGRPGRCRVARVVVGGDVFHAMEGRTRRGTPLERDRPDTEVFQAALGAFVDGIGALRAVAESVDYDGVPGNHDGIHEWYLRMALSLYFRDAADVWVNTHERKRAFFHDGVALHVFDHGEEFTRFDYTRLTKAELIARMTGEPFAQAEKVYFYVGHTHHREQKSWGPHLELIRANTLAHTNDHEEGLVFYGEPEVSFYALDAKGRIATEQRVYLTDAP